MIEDNYNDDIELLDEPEVVDAGDGTLYEHWKPELERIRNSYTKSRESRENISEKQIRSGRRHSFFPTCNPKWIKRSDRM